MTDHEMDLLADYWSDKIAAIWIWSSILTLPLGLWKLIELVTALVRVRCQ